MSHNRRNSILEIVGIALTILGMIISTSQGSTSLAYKVVDSSPLIRPEAVSQDWQLFYKTREVSDPKLIIYRITNSGAIPIARRDYEGPIKIDLGEGTSILETSAAIATYSQGQEESEYVRQDGAEVLSDEPHVVKVEPTLLNPKDSLLLKIIAENVITDNLSIPSIRAYGVKNLTPLRSEASLHYIPLKFSSQNLLIFTVCLSALSALLFTLWVRLRVNPVFSRKITALLSVVFFLFLWSLLGLSAIV